MNKLLITNNLKKLSHLIKSILCYPFKLIFNFVKIVFSELLSITFRDVIKFVLVSFISKFGWELLKTICFFLIALIGTYIKYGRF